MAYDKVVDSQQLDGAIKATADAIRTKTLNKDPIPWSKDTGFSDVIARLKTTNGFLMGSFEIPENFNVTQTKALVLDGLKGKPLHVIAFYMGERGEPTLQTGTLCYFEKGLRDSVFQLNGQFTVLEKTDRYTINLTDDGFQVYGDNVYTCYVAVGLWGYVVVTEESGSGACDETCDDVDIQNAVVENHTLILSI